MPDNRKPQQQNDKQPQKKQDVEQPMREPQKAGKADKSELDTEHELDTGDEDEAVTQRNPRVDDDRE